MITGDHGAADAVRRPSPTPRSSNVVRDLGAGRWLVERGIAEVVGVIVQLPDGSHVVHLNGATGIAPRFADSSDAVTYAQGATSNG